MPKLGTYGSVRGALSNGCLYRDCVSKSEGLDAAEAAKCTVRRGDWVRRMRLWSAITRESEGNSAQRPGVARLALQSPVA